MSSDEAADSAEIHSVQNEDIRESEAPLVIIPVYKIWLNFNNELYASVEPESPNDCHVPFPSKSLFDTLTSRPNEKVNQIVINEAMAKEGNGEIHSMPNSGIII